MQMDGHYDFYLVALSVLVAILASYVALGLAFSVRQAKKGLARTVWLTFGALAMGLGIWSMHFVGMLAFRMPGMEMSYDIPLFALSIGIAVAASALALYIVSRPKVPVIAFVFGGLAMAVAISGMHYTGMFSMRMAATIDWNLWLVGASVMIALAASFSALVVSLKLRDNSDHQWLQLAAAVLMGFGIAGMHYTGMEAATFIHSDVPFVQGSRLLASDSLAFLVTAGTILIMIIAIAATVIDRAITARTKRAEESERLFRQAERAVAELQKERDLRNRFVSALAHDLRTPIAAASMSMELILRGSKDPGTLEKLAQKGIESLERMEQMIQDLLDANRITAGQTLPLHFESCTVGGLVGQTVEDLVTVYGNRFELNLNGGANAHAFWDGKYMRRALENLCTNAIKYGDDGKPIQVSARTDGANRRVSLSVHNYGAALAQEDRQRLFDLFSRGNNAQVSGTKGWGLGLTIVKGIAEAHQGRVEVESLPGLGTTFTIDVPLDPRNGLT